MAQTIIECIRHCVLYSENNENIATILYTYSDKYWVSRMFYFYDQDRVANKQTNIFLICTNFLSEKFNEGLPI